MAAIDLKNVTIYLQDGYSGPGGTFLVNNGAGYAAAATTVVVDGGTGIINNGDRLTFASEAGTPVHTVTAHSETTGNTTSITFTPALTDAIIDDDPITILPHKLAVEIGEGTLTYSESRQFKYFLERGLLNTVREEDQVPMDVKLDFTWEFLRSDDIATPSIEEILKHYGNASHWVTSSADTCEPFAVDIILENVPPCAGEDQEEIVLPDFRWEKLDHDAKAATVSVTGKCNAVTATITRS